jgi:mevalonate pyrophosphate decarboxylase
MAAVAAAVVAAQSVDQPSPSNNIVSILQMWGSSSTTRSRRGIVLTQHKAAGKHRRLVQ